MRAVSRNDIPEDYKFQASITDHPIVIDESGVYRYKASSAVRWIIDNTTILNDMWVAYRRGHIDRDDMMEFYRDMGYSLSGYEDVLGDELDNIQGVEGGS